MDPERVKLELNTESVMHEFGILIGRFQPFHNAHLELVRFALNQAQTLVIGVGSCNQAPDTRNPWDGTARAEMILACLSEEERKRVRFAYLEDFYYSNDEWIANVQRAIGAHTGESKDVKIIGHEKDSTSFYLKLFPQWGPHIEPPVNTDLSATKVRSLLFTQDKIGIKNLLPTPVYEKVASWMDDSVEFKRLHDEQHHVWDLEEERRGSKFPPHFVTVDAVCICSGHVLVVRRGGKYGRGQIALPGGYIDVTETLQKSSIRELKEETAIKIPAADLAKMIVDRDCFDHPLRDLRGRLITHAFKFQLPDGPLPKVKGSDDADKAWWMTFEDVDTNKPLFFSDHWHIIRRFRGPTKNF